MYMIRKLTMWISTRRLWGLLLGMSVPVALVGLCLLDAPLVPWRLPMGSAFNLEFDVSSGGRDATTRVHPLIPDRFQPLIEGGARSPCKPGHHLYARLRVLDTPIVNDLVTFEVMVRNDMDAGNFSWWLDFEPGHLDPGRGRVRFSDRLEKGELRIARVVARVTSLEPFLVSAMLLCEDRVADHFPPAQDAKRILPLVVDGDFIRAHWDPITRRGESKSVRRVQPRAGQMAVLVRAGSVTPTIFRR